MKATQLRLLNEVTHYNKGPLFPRATWPPHSASTAWLYNFWTVPSITYMAPYFNCILGGWYRLNITWLKNWQWFEKLLNYMLCNKLFKMLCTIICHVMSCYFILCNILSNIVCNISYNLMLFNTSYNILYLFSSSLVLTATFWYFAYVIKDN